MSILRSKRLPIGSLPARIKPGKCFGHTGITKYLISNTPIHRLDQMELRAYRVMLEPEERE